MNLQAIHTPEEHEAMLEWIDEQFEKKVKKGTDAGRKLEVALILVKDFEDKNYPVPLPDAVEAIKQKMKQYGLKNKDLVGKIGSKGYVSSLLNKRKPLTLQVAKWMHKELGIPAEILLG